ncbi:MAG TPA: DegT/DnrJ/EryC1/StrS family aminotransferase [Aliidongia sp.]|nr:DegT/DnrJ/EryC1/StrS family aminotransferase [Aliidongia sp.]
MSIPQMDLAAVYRAQKAELDAAVARVLESGWYILGAEVAAFEREFAEMLGLGRAVGVASGTDALILGLRAVGIGPGDKVATVAHTAVATVAAIELIGASAVMVDIEPATCTMDPAELERSFAAIPGIKAIIPVHLYGQSAEMEAIMATARRHGAKVVEDCAQCQGAAFMGRPVGGFGDAATFSFYPTKNLGAFGDGGAVTASDPAIIERLHQLRQYGWKQRYVSDTTGYNSRLDELQAAILRVRLPRLAAENARRGEIAAAYGRGLGGLPLTLPGTRAGASHVWHQYVVRSGERDALQERLKQAGIGTNIHYPVPVHLQPAYAGRLLCGPSGLGQTEKAAREVLSLPMYPQLGDEAVAQVIAAVRKAVGG